MNAPGETPASHDGAARPYKYEYKYRYKYGAACPPGTGDAGDAPAGNAPMGGADAGEPADGRRPDDRQGPQDAQGQAGADDRDSAKQGGNDGHDEDADTRKRNRLLLILAAVFVLAGAAWLLYYLLVMRRYASTDDAYVQGHQVAITARVAGTVVEVAVDDTDRVHAGQVLVRLDPVDARTRLAQAAGQLAQAVRQAQQAVAQASLTDASVAQRQADYARALADYERRRPLLAKHAIAPEELDTARRQLESARAALRQAERQSIASHVLVDGTRVREQPAVQQARAQYRQAWVDDQRNAIVAPIEGYAARRQVEVGQQVQPGQTLLTVVPLDRLWVDANFKETQLAHLRIGQPVEVVADIDSDITYHGKVVGLSPGTGSAFSLLPPENATGNWIKVVQRLPVRVSLDASELRQHPLRIGLSTTATVDTADRSGPVLAPTAREQPLMATAVYERELRNADAAAEAIIRANLVMPDADAPASGPVPAKAH